MSRKNAGAPPARSIVASANGGQEFVRRFVLCFMLFSVLSIVAPAAGTAAVRTTQNPSAAWSCRGVYHVVGRGETIYSIARRYGTTAYRIAVCNGLASYTVYVGQTLLVPTARR